MPGPHTGMPHGKTRWAPGIIFDLMALDGPKVRCNTSGKVTYNPHLGSRAHSAKSPWSGSSGTSMFCHAPLHHHALPCVT